MRKYSIILIESELEKRTALIDVLNNHQQFVLVGSAISENKARQILQSFIPSIVLCNAEFISRGFIRWIAPFFESKDIVFIIYGKEPSGEKELKLVECFLKVQKAQYLQISRYDDSFELNNSCNEILRLMLNSTVSRTPPLIQERTPPLAEKIIIFGSSAGGPRILNAILGKLTPPIHAGIIIVQHLPESFAYSLVKSISNSTVFPVREAENEMPIYEDHIYVAPGNYHLELAKHKFGAKCVLTQNPPECGCRPSINVLMSSVPKIFNKKSIGIILTGMGNDGANGVQTIKNSGGITIAQDKETSMIFGMPQSAIETGCIDYILPYTKIPSQIIDIVPSL